MTKDELVRALAHRLRISNRQANDCLDILADMAGTALVEGDEFTLPGIGKLGVKATAARKGRNPATGAPLDIPAGRKVTFKPAKALRDAVGS